MANAKTDKYWTLSMVLAWIGTKDIEAVEAQKALAAQAPAPGESQSIWQIHNAAKQLAKMNDPVSSFFATGETRFDPFRDAWKSLVQEATAGNIEATALNQTRQEVSIPRGHWGLLEFDRDGQTEYALKLGRDAAVRYTNVEFLAHDVSRLWGQPGVGIDKPPVLGKKNAPVLQLAKEAIQAIWPNGIPLTEKKKTRNKKISDWCKAKGHNNPGDRTINTAIKSIP